MILRTGLLLFFKFSQCKKTIGDGNHDKNTTEVDDNSEDIRSDSNDPVTPLSDLMILFLLAFFAITFLYFFIRYLLRKKKASSITSDIKNARNTRRHRFGRIRKNSGSRPWLYPLDPLPRLAPETPADDHDADKFIQFDISPETVLKEQDPFRVSEAAEENWFGWMDYMGIVTAAILSFLLIFILSSIEEQ